MSEPKTVGEFAALCADADMAIARAEKAERVLKLVAAERDEARRKCRSLELALEAHIKAEATAALDADSW